MEETILQAYLRLLYLSKFPESKLGRLLANFGSLNSVVSAAENSTITGLNKNEHKILRQVFSQPTQSTPLLANTFGWLEADEDNHLLCFDSPSYPRLLKQIDCPPPLLFIKGDVRVLGSAACAMVGSRKASHYGLRIAGWLANDLSKLGLTIVSGLALGIDSRCHQMTLSAGGPTIAVLGCGVDVIYPKQNAQLKDEICQTGAVISEYPLGTEPRPHHFPRRNRIISGISLGLIVVEAAERSGSLITARQAMEQGRDVFAVPGQIGTSNSKGSHRLIKDGAGLIESAADVATVILESWNHSPDPRQQETAREISLARNDEKGLGQKVLKAITEPECLMENIAMRTRLSIAEVQYVLLELEVSGMVQIQGGRVSRCD